MSLRVYITNNFAWKLLSLVLAIIMWLTIRASFREDQLLMDNPVETTSRRKLPDIPVALLTSSSNSSLYRLEPASADVEITGTLEALNKFNVREISVFVDLGNVGDEKQFRKPVQWKCPDGIQVTSVSPPQVLVERLSPTK